MANEKAVPAIKLFEQDPFHAREQAKYDHPVPSREYMLQVLADLGKPISYEDLRSHFDITNPDQQAALHHRLKAMLRDGQLFQNRRRRFGVADKVHQYAGVVEAHPDGFGFLLRDEGGQDLFLAPREMQALFHGDRIMASIAHTDRRGRPHGKVSKVLERAISRLIGRFHHEDGVAYVVPGSPRILHDVQIPKESWPDTLAPQWVEAEIVHYPSRHRPAVGKILRCLGERSTAAIDSEIVLNSYDLPQIWTEEVLAEVAALEAESFRRDTDREVLTELPLVTIDGEDSRDFDDAVACVANAQGWQLTVAIADVAHYVPVGGALDKEAVERGTSVYFPDRVVPMLPERLSNDLCSLKPHEDRPCLACIMQLDRQGEVCSSRFVRGIMHSAARLTYTEVAAFVEHGQAVDDWSALVRDNLSALHELYGVMRQAAQRRGMLELPIKEPKLVLDEAGEVSDIRVLDRNDAHRMIELYMVAANAETSRFLQRHEVPAMFRNHPQPEEDALRELSSFLLSSGLRWEGDLDSISLAALMREVAERPEAGSLAMGVLRAMKAAEYSPANLGHFGLGLEDYTHFTSPIRRYPDLVVHRAIAAILAGTGGKLPKTDRLAVQCSERERRAEQASREVTKRYQCRFMLDKVGQDFAGIITGVTHFGMFVSLSPYGVDGMLHISRLPNDYYQHDASQQCLRGEKDGRCFGLGDEVTVRLKAVDLEQMRLELDWTD